jgi:hypothetical protein
VNLFVSGPLKLGESSMHQTHRCRSFANGRSHPLDASSADIAHCKHSWQAALQHQRRARKRPWWIPIWVNRQWQIASGEDKALLIKSDTAPQPVGIRGGAGHDEEVMGRDRTHLPGLLVDPTYFLEVILALKTA